jgi:hypothetical protein
MTARRSRSWTARAPFQGRWRIAEMDDPAGTRVVWIADFLPDDAEGEIDVAMEAGAQAMKAALDRLDPDAT